MPTLPDCRTVEPSELLESARTLHDEGWRLITASCVPRAAGWTVLYHFERDDRLTHLRVELGPDGAVPSLGSVYASAFLVENEMAELQGLEVTDLAIDYRGRLYRDFDGPEVWPAVTTRASSILETAGLTRLDACVPVVGDEEVRASTTRVPAPPASIDDPRAGAVTWRRPSFPFGPQHPVLAEPIQLELTLEDEIVLDVVPGLGYVHRGIEAETERRPYAEDLPLLERVCGICSVAHAVAYAQAVETLAEVEVPRRARLLRLFWFELTRIHSHLLWLGLAGDAIGLEALFQSCWRVREQVLDLFTLTAGNRVILGVVELGGVRHDLPDDIQPVVRAGLDSVERGIADIRPLALDNDAVARRLSGVGTISHEDAVELGLVGPTVRASGVAIDVRTSSYGAYDELDGRTDGRDRRGCPRADGRPVARDR